MKNLKLLALDLFAPAVIQAQDLSANEVPFKI